jgi:predicted Zn-dependent protease
MADRIAALRALCGGPRDGALLRMSLAQALRDAGAGAEAVAELRRALDFDPDYSAAWKLLGGMLAAQDDRSGAIAAYTSGIAAAQKRGDKQAEKEMTVFLRRLSR